MVEIGTGTAGTRFVNTDWPIEEGLEAGTQKQTGRIMNLEIEEQDLTLYDSEEEKL